MDILATVYMLAFAACGILIARPVFRKDDPFRRIFFGLVFGLVMLIWLPTLLAFFLGFTKTVQYLALGIAVAAAGAATVVSILRNRRGPQFSAFERKKLGHELIPLLIAAVPLAAIGFILHLNHTIVPASNGSLHVGQCTYGDLCMHLGFISSISVQQTFPPDYSILPGTPLGYPFLCDSVSSTFYSLGASLRTAALLPALYAYLVVVLGVYFFFDTWFRSKKTAVLATYMFFIGGGLGFAYVFNNKQLLEVNGIDRVQEVLTGWYRTPTNIPDEGLRWVNAIADMLVPQRATLFGWALLFPALQLLFRGAIRRENRVFIPLGIIAGAMPLVHTHSFVALGIISIVLFIAACLRLVKEYRPGDDSALTVRIIVCLIVMTVFCVLRLLPIRVENGAEGFDLSACTVGCAVAFITAMGISVFALIRSILNKKSIAFPIAAVAVSLIAGYAALSGVERKSTLLLFAPAAAAAVLLLTVLLLGLTDRKRSAEEIPADAEDTEPEETEVIETAAEETGAIETAAEETGVEETAAEPIDEEKAEAERSVPQAEEKAEAPGEELPAEKPVIREDTALRRTIRNILAFALFGVIAVLLAAPQIFGFTLKQSADNEQFLRWSFNWANNSDSWLWFYIKNLGLIFILMPVAFLTEKKQSRIFFAGGLAIWAISEILLFQPNPYDNNKLLFVWFALSCGIVAHLIVKKLTCPVQKFVNGVKKTDAAATAARFILLITVLAAIFTSGVMTLHREYISGDHWGTVTDAATGEERFGYSENGYEVVPAYLVELCDWVKENTEPDATFLTDNNHNNAVAMLTGRNIFCGSGTFLYFHGVNYRPREALIRPMYSEPEEFLLLNSRIYGIDFVLIGPNEKNKIPELNIMWFRDNLECVYDNGHAAIYKIPKPREISNNGGNE
ncbi:MAG: hypothetical protein IJM20_00810 [Clostridia bacterium]|nr:hypothetical protein [Clostridia bacterium]